MKSGETDSFADAAGSDGLLPEVPGWFYYIGLIYLGFLFMPLLSAGHDRVWLWPTLLSIPVFLYLYRRIIRLFRNRLIPRPTALPELLTIALMAYVLAFFNESANTYVIYCMAAVPFALSRFKHLVLLEVLLLIGYALALWVAGFNPVLLGITAVIGMAAGATNYIYVEHRRKNVMLRLAREEVHRLERVAERERIGRDLHDLLGHTLSLIAIKSELAAKLIERDKAAAAREVTEVTHIAREALKQVRTAVTGIRSAALENEVASARALLETDGVALTFEREGGLLPPEVETAVAMILREAVTNIQRHAQARRATVEVVTRAVASVAGTKGQERVVLLTVSDDGRGGIEASGNGLTGIRERVRALAGTLEIDSPRGKGTTLRVSLPLLDARGGAASSATSAVLDEREGVARRLGPGFEVMRAGGESMRAAGESEPLSRVRGAEGT